MSDQLQVRDIIQALQNVDPTLPVCVRMWRGDDEGMWSDEGKLLAIKRRSIDILLETNAP